MRPPIHAVDQKMEKNDEMSNKNNNYNEWSILPLHPPPLPLLLLLRPGTHKQRHSVIFLVVNRKKFTHLHSHATPASYYFIINTQHFLMPEGKTLSNLIAELSLCTKWHVTQHVAHDKHLMCTPLHPYNLIVRVGRPFTLQWGDCEKSWIALFNATIITII